MSQNREKMLSVKPFNKNSWNLEIQAKKVWQIFFLQDKKVQIIVFDYSKVTQCFLFLKVLSKLEILFHQKCVQATLMKPIRNKREC